MKVVAKKSLGQHFLIDPTYLAHIVAAAELGPADQVLEIGPGRGVLTRELAARAGVVVAVELDDRLIEPLRAEFARQSHVQIVHGDILELDPPALFRDLLPGADDAPRPDSGDETTKVVTTESPLTPHPSPLATRHSPLSYKVVANLPYYITSALLRHLLEASLPPALAVLLVQLEVARRICAGPGDLSLLAVSVQFYAQPRFVERVPAGAFRPVPKVDSAVLRLDVRPQPAVATDPEYFFGVVRAGFSQKRKQLLNSLSAGLQRPKHEILAALEAAGIVPARRAETVSLEEWGQLCEALASTPLPKDRATS